MKLNNKGFAISSIMYLILVLVIILITVTLSILGSRKLIIDKTKHEVLNNIYNVENITYREVLSILKEEAITYAENNSIENDSILISDLNSEVEKETLKNYKLSTKYLTILKNNNSYNVYLGESKKVSSINEPIDGLIDIIDYNISGNSVQNGNPSPSTPVDILSVGDYDNTTGKYVIPITVSGKNLFSPSMITATSKIINPSTGEIEVWGNRWGISDYIKIKPNTTYTLSSNNILSLSPSRGIALYDENKNYIGGTPNFTTTSNLHTFTTGDNAKYIRLSVIIEDRLMLEESSSATNYEPYHEPITTNIYLDEPLRKIGDYVDYIDLKNKTVTRNIKMVDMGSLSWNRKSTGVFVADTEDMKVGTSTGIPEALCDIYQNAFGVYSGVNIYRNEANNYFLASSSYIKSKSIAVNDFRHTTTSAFVESISGKNIYYALENGDNSETIELPVLSASDGHNNISIDTNIKPSNVEFIVIKKIKQI